MEASLLSRLARGVQTIVFDYDGTLHNSALLYYEAFQHTYRYLVACGMAPRRDFSLSEATAFLGLSPNEMWAKCVPALGASDRDAAILMLGNRLEAGARDGAAVLYPGALETVSLLRKKGYRTVLLSHCPASYLSAHGAAFHLDRYFDGLFATGAFGYAPKHQVFASEIKPRFPGGFLIVGDRESDMAIGRHHGAAAIGCRYGFGTEAELETASVLIDDIRALQNMPAPRKARSAPPPFL